MSNVTYYKSVMEEMVHSNIITIAFLILFFVAALFLLRFLNKKASDSNKIAKFKTQKKVLIHQKKLRAERVRTVVMYSLISICFLIGISVGIKNITDCLYDAQHNNYITYSGNIEVTTELGLGWKSHRTKYKIIFDHEDGKVSLNFDPDQYDLTKGTHHNITVVYSGRSQILLEIQGERN